MALHEHSRAKGYSLWEAVRTHEKFLERERVPAIPVGEAVELCLKDKDGETRIIEPLTPNLVEWIGVIRQSSQSPLPLTNLRRRWDRAKQVLDRKWPHDAMRHSYASYHFAMFGNAGLTSKNLGHPDTTLLRKDYNGAVTKAQAKTFWAILPKHCR